jgi:hypothetical protein
MKKTFSLNLPDTEDSKVLAAIKLELNKYVKRERRKELPAGVDFWDFHCKVGSDSETAMLIPLPDIPETLDALALGKAAQVYVEILASPGYRVKKPFERTYQQHES